METRATAVGERIRAARKRKGMSQVALSQILGERFERPAETMRRSLVNWEGGKHEPRGRYLDAIAEATEQPLDFFRSTPRRDGAPGAVDGDGVADDRGGVRVDAA